MIIKFPGGQVVDVQFDDVAHSYVVAHQHENGEFSDTRPIHGITAPLEVVPKPFLKPWAAKMAAEALMVEVADLNWTAEEFAQFFVDKKAMDENERYTDEKGKDKPVMSTYSFNKKYPFFSKAKTAYKTKSDNSKDIGHWLHSAIEQFYKSNRKQLPVFDEETKPLWDSFVMFDNFFKPVPDEDGLEFLVYSLRYVYSGQGDFRGKMNGKTCIGDWKTTNRSYANVDGISVEYFFQLGGLAQAEFERTGVWVDDLFIANFDKKGGEPRVIWASEFGMSPQDCARAYISCFNNYHTIKEWDYRFSKR